VIGITNRGTLIDGGTVNVPEFGFASADGRWVIEGEGVAPDIEVAERPEECHRRARSAAWSGVCRKYSPISSGIRKSCQVARNRP
jgi:C-terminal processing protease CtpA/Prc